MFEKKLNLILIPHIFLWKVQTSPPEVIQVILQALKPFVITVCRYFVYFQAIKSMPSTSNFYTNAITFVNRVVVMNRELFLKECLDGAVGQTEGGFSAFVRAWMQKMELIVSQEARRVNLLALYSLLPFFSA